MTTTDPIADMFTRIRNGQQAVKANVRMPASKLKQAIAEVLKSEGFIEDFNVQPAGSGAFPVLDVRLRYHMGRGVIERIDRISRPGLRTYRGVTELPNVNAFGIAIVSTPKGVMTDRAARKAGVGGEVLGVVS